MPNHARQYVVSSDPIKDFLFHLWDRIKTWAGNASYWPILPIGKKKPTGGVTAGPEATVEIKYTGAQDSQSVRGYVGDTGVIGLTGYTGVIGLAGCTGTQGTPDSQGVRGYVGIGITTDPAVPNRFRKCMTLAENTIPYGSDEEIKSMALKFVNLPENRVEKLYQDLIKIKPFSRFDLAKLSSSTGPK
jgi:hypothetical protein